MTKDETFCQRRKRDGVSKRNWLRGKRKDSSFVIGGRYLDSYSSLHRSPNSRTRAAIHPKVLVNTIKIVILIYRSIPLNSTGLSFTGEMIRDLKDPLHQTTRAKGRTSRADLFRPLLYLRSTKNRNLSET